MVTFCSLQFILRYVCPLLQTRGHMDHFKLANISIHLPPTSLRRQKLYLEESSHGSNLSAKDKIKRSLCGQPAQPEDGEIQHNPSFVQKEGLTSLVCITHHTSCLTAQFICHQVYVFPISSYRKLRTRQRSRPIF